MLHIGVGKIRNGSTETVMGMVYGIEFVGQWASGGNGGAPSAGGGPSDGSGPAGAPAATDNTAAPAPSSASDSGLKKVLIGLGPGMLLMLGSVALAGSGSFLDSLRALARI